MENSQKVQMQDGFQYSEMVENIRRRYDFHTMYIDNYGQMLEAQEKNEEIKSQLKDLGVSAISNDGEFFIKIK